jgi:uncharacterized protein (TIGR03437 family)
MRLPPAVLLALVASWAAFGQSYTITTVAGDGKSAYSGDNGPATSAGIDPTGVAVDSSGNIYIADGTNDRIRKVANGTITTFASAPAVTIGLNSAGDPYYSNDYAIFEYLNGKSVTVAGTPNISGFSGDGGSATKATLYSPHDVAIDSAGNLFIADTENSRVRKVSGGIISTVAGSGNSTLACDGFSGDNGPATSALLCDVYGIAVDSQGNLYIADSGNQRIRKVTNGIITTVAGNGTYGFSGDGGPALGASFDGPTHVAVDAGGNLYIYDSGNHRIRMVSNGIVSTIAGDGIAGFGGDEGPAVLAQLGNVGGLAVSGSNLLIADVGNSRIRKLAPVAEAPGAPTITSGGIVPLYSTVSTIQPGEWISIYGTNLGPAPYALWKGDFPTLLGGTSVTIDGKLSYLWLVSPGQINLQAPGDTTIGPVPVVVTTAAGSYTSVVTLAQYSPSFSLLDSKHVAGIILRADGSGADGGGSYDILGPTGTSLGYPTVAAKGGDNIELFAVGLGPTTPAVTPGQAYSGAASTTNAVGLTIGGTNVHTAFAGLTGAGLYQINAAVPVGLGTGDLPLVLTVGTDQTPSNVVISLQDPVPPPGGIESLSLNPGTASSLATVTGEITLYSPAPASETITLYANNSAAAGSLPATINANTGYSSVGFSFSPGVVSGNTPVVITASYSGSSAQATLTVTPTPACTSIAGAWDVYESGSDTPSLTAGGETDTETDGIAGGGDVTIAQNGCSISYLPVANGTVDGSGLTQSQLASLARTGTVSGDNVTVTGPLVLLSSVEAIEIEENPGLVINTANVGSNVVNGTGTVTGSTMNISETGLFTVTGSYSDSGVNGSYSLTITSSSTANFTWTNGQRPQLRSTTPQPAIRVRLQSNGTAGQQESIAERLSRVFGRAVKFADR